MFIAACSMLPWHHHAAAPPEPSTALRITAAGGITLPQYWRRNDVVIDLSAVSGTGSAVLQPAPAHAWPVRVALRVRPGSVGELEVRGDQRWVVPVAGSGAPVDLELPAGLYARGTAQITVSWGAVVSTPGQ
jgi:hypothetical protein